MKLRSKSETRCSVNTTFNLKANVTHNDLKNTILEFFERLTVFWIDLILYNRLHRHYNLVTWGSLIAQLVKNLPAMQESWVQFLGQEDPLEKEMATHSSILAWRIPWTEESGRLQSVGSQESDMTWQQEKELILQSCFSFFKSRWSD